MGQGWIKLHRRIRDHFLSKEPRVYSKYEAWLYLMMEANHAEGKALIDGRLVVVERGSFITSKLQLADLWQWSRTKVDSYLELLKIEGMLTYKSDNKKTTIFITNYDSYQGKDAPEDTTEVQADQTPEKKQENITETTEEHQKSTNKNNQELKNEKNNKEEEHLFDDGPLIFPSGLNNEPCKNALNLWVKYLEQGFRKRLPRMSLEALLMSYTNRGSEFIKDIRHSMHCGYRKIVTAPAAPVPPTPPNPSKLPITPQARQILSQVGLSGAKTAGFESAGSIITGRVGK